MPVFTARARLRMDTDVADSPPVQDTNGIDVSMNPGAAGMVAPRGEEVDMLISPPDTIAIEMHRRAMIREAARSRAIERARGIDHAPPLRLQPRAATGRRHRLSGLVAHIVFRRQRARPA